MCVRVCVCVLGVFLLAGFVGLLRVFCVVRVRAREMRAAVSLTNPRVARAHTRMHARTHARTRSTRSTRSTASTARTRANTRAHLDAAVAEALVPVAAQLARPQKVVGARHAGVDDVGHHVAAVRVDRDQVHDLFWWLFWGEGVGSLRGGR